jgi:hypothetical protein
MAVRCLIIGYATLWLAWDLVVWFALTRGGRRSLLPLGFGSSVTIMACAFVPVLALAAVLCATAWVPADARDMLSLMTPVSLGLFAGAQVRRRGASAAAISEEAHLSEEGARSHSTLSR